MGVRRIEHHLGPTCVFAHGASPLSSFSGDCTYYKLMWLRAIENQIDPGHKQMQVYFSRLARKSSDIPRVMQWLKNVISAPGSIQLSLVCWLMVCHLGVMSHSRQTNQQQEKAICILLSGRQRLPQNTSPPAEICLGLNDQNWITWRLRD